MRTAYDRLRALGVETPDIMLPKKGTDLKKWAVVACDQYTSEQEYWERVRSAAGDSPSTFNLIFPEAYLEEPDPGSRIALINSTMDSYVKQGLFESYEESFFLVHRTSGPGPGRWGLVLALDLEQYDYSEDSRTRIRATEGTILSRIPPRKRIRRDASLELPHILVLISDEDRTVIEPLATMRSSFELMYDTDLMENGGHVTAYRVHGEPVMSRIAEAFEALHAKLDRANPMLFAMGDGNHSLATAKSCWVDIKKSLSEKEIERHPARFALVEIENIFDEGLVFEPIHRVLFDIDKERFLAELSKHCSSYRIEHASDVETVISKINDPDAFQSFGYVDKDSLAVITLYDPSASIPAGTLQSVIDTLVEAQVQVDYIHGENVTHMIGSRKGNIGLFLPVINKHTFFDTIIQDGALPRKTFSMGEAHEKRFYMEARKIK